MTDTQPYHHDDGAAWTGSELATELHNRGLPVSGNNADKLARLEADDRGDLEPDVADDQADDVVVTVADQWADVARADGSRDIAWIGDGPDPRKPVE